MPRVLVTLGVAAFTAGVVAASAQAATPSSHTPIHKSGAVASTWPGSVVPPIRHIGPPFVL